MTLTSLFDDRNSHRLKKRTETVHFLNSTAQTLEVDVVYLICDRKAPIKSWLESRKT